jgi:hypothetical protein
VAVEREAAMAMGHGGVAASGLSELMLSTILCAFCAFVSVRCRCSQNAQKTLTMCSQHFVSVTENCRKQFTKFSLKNTGLSGELILFQS